MTAGTAGGGGKRRGGGTTCLRTLRPPVFEILDLLFVGGIGFGVGRDMLFDKLFGPALRFRETV